MLLKKILFLAVGFLATMPLYGDEKDEYSGDLIMQHILRYREDFAGDLQTFAYRFRRAPTHGRSSLREIIKKLFGQPLFVNGKPVENEKLVFDTGASFQVDWRAPLRRIIRFRFHHGTLTLRIEHHLISVDGMESVRPYSLKLHIETSSLKPIISKIVIRKYRCNEVLREWRK